MKPLFIHYCYNMLELSDMMFHAPGHHSEILKDQVFSTHGHNLHAYGNWKREAKPRSGRGNEVCRFDSAKPRGIEASQRQYKKAF